MRKSKLAVAVLGALFAMGANAGQFVLQSSKWGAAQEAAVARAGGTVKFASDKAGLAVVESDNPAFMAQVGIPGNADRMVEFTPPTMVQDAVDPSNDIYYANVQWAPQSVQAPEAWALDYTGAGVRVAVIDGGIFNAHPDLDANVDTTRSRSFATGTPDGCVELYNCDLGTFWHGTHVAGIIAAEDNNTGVVGIAPHATIVGVKALHGGSGSFGAIINAIVYAATPMAEGGGGADIINMSLGAVFPKNDPEAHGLVAALNKAVNYAGSRGVLVVSSAGNDAIDADHAWNYTITPAESGSGIAVSATAPIGFALGATNFSEPTSYTNYGNSLVWVSGPGGDAMLPGDDLCTRPPVANFPCWVFDLVLSTSRAGYSWAGGTSMSAPAVSAVAALIKQRNPNATPAQMKAALARSATDAGKVGHDNFHGRGYVNALRAVTQ